MYTLSEDERIELATFVASQAAGRVAVVATGNSGGGDMEAQAAFCTRMAAVKGVNAVVILTCLLAKEDESEEVWMANATRLMELTSCALGLYEVPAPYQRLLSAELLAWCAASGRFLFHKDTCCIPAQIEAKIKAVQALGDQAGSFRFYNANIETINFSNRLGGAGFSGISGNFYPWIMAALCDPDSTLSESDKDKLQAFVSLAEVAICDQYPFSAKAYLGQYDIPITTKCRSRDFPAYNAVQNLHIAAMKDLMEIVCASAGVQPISPSMSGPKPSPAPGGSTSATTRVFKRAKLGRDD
jgi:4-hydroxy-tetrahydrodipicolinate synthase